MGGEYCSVVGCNNNSKTRKKLSFFRLPKNRATLIKWLQLIGREDCLESPRVHNRVCSVHFPPTMFINKRLTNGAFPQLYLPGKHDDPLELLTILTTHEGNHSRVENGDAEHVATQTENDTADLDKLLMNEANRKMRLLKTALNVSEMKRKKLERDIEMLKKQSADQATASISGSRKRTLKSSIDLAHQSTANISENRKITRHMIGSDVDITHTDVEPTEQFIKWQNDLKTKLKGNIDDAKLNYFAFNMYMTSPSTYKFLENTFKLPSMKTLQNMKMNIRPGLNEDIIELLSQRLKKVSLNHKYCMLCLDEAELNQQLYYDITNDEIEGLEEIAEKTKHIACKVVVAMLKGCIENFKHPLGYVFTSAVNNYFDLSTWIDETIKLLIDAGFEVRAVVSKQSPLFVHFAEFKGVTVDSPFFTVDSNIVYYIFEAADVIKRIRDDLLTYDLLYDDKLVSWDYVEAFYNNDKEKEIKIASQLTDKHMNPNTAERTITKYATDIFCHSVAAGIATDIELGNLPPKARDTADFLIAINKIYSILNSSKYRSDNYELTSLDANDQLKYLKHALDMFENIKVFNPSDVNMKTTSFTGLRITINAILMLFDYFVGQNFKQMYTGRFNNNAAESFLLSIRKTGRLVQKPSAILFKNTFSKLTLNSLLNCLNNFKDDLVSFLECKDTHGLFARELLQEETTLLVQTTDYRFDLPVHRDSFRYACSYLLKKCTLKHACPVFRRYLRQNEDEELRVPPGFNCKLKLFANLTAPPEDFVEYIEVFENIFLKTFKTAALGVEPGKNLLNEMQNIEHHQPCSCFPVNYLIKLFIRMRIHFVVKFNNRKLKTENINILSIEHL